MSTGSKLVIAMVVMGTIGGIVAYKVNTEKQKKGPQVETQKIERQDIVAHVSCNGKTEARSKVDISANVMGEIINLAVAEGEAVEKGQFLLQIDRAQLQAQTTGSKAAIDALRADAEAARANLQQSRLDFDRAKKNFEQLIIPEAEYQRATAGVDSAAANVRSIERRIEQARATLEGAEDSLSKTTIRAPIAGVVTALPVEAGEIAVIGTMNNAGTKLMTISDMSVIEAVMEVDETDVPRVQIGQPATLTIDAFDDRTYQGVVSEIGSSPITQATNQAVEFSVKIIVQDPPAAIRPGFSVSAEIETGVRENAVGVPVQALVVQDLGDKLDAAEAERAAKSAALKTKDAKERDVEGVYKVVDKKAVFTPVETGLQGELLLEVLDGLGEGDEVIMGPFRVLRSLKDGDPVQVATESNKDELGPK